MREMTLSEIQQVSLEILKDIHNFCVNNDVKYSLSGGTLLGAIRHNGFIPWDDDIDIQMSRPEYEKFIHSYQSEHGYKLFSHELDGFEDVGIAYARVCEMEKTYVNTGIQPWKKEATGLWVDIFPIDGAPDNPKKAKIKIEKMYWMWRLTLAARMRYKLDFGTTKGFFVKIRQYFKILTSYIIPWNIIPFYIDKCKEYSYETNNYLANYSIIHYKFKEWQPKVEMSDFVLHRFENEEFYIMTGYDISLRSLYGNYMELPPEEKRINHSNYVYYWK